MSVQVYNYHGTVLVLRYILGTRTCYRYGSEYMGSDLDPLQSEKADPDPHQGVVRTATLSSVDKNYAFFFSVSNNTDTYELGSETPDLENRVSPLPDN
jgi:hypothetical protein